MDRGSAVQLVRRTPTFLLVLTVLTGLLLSCGDAEAPAKSQKEPESKEAAAEAEPGENREAEPEEKKPGEKDKKKEKVQWTPPTFKEGAEERAQMVRQIRERYELTDRAVLAAMSQVPRHEFVPKYGVEESYEDTPLSIGYGQTISQPYIVAEMTRLMELDEDSRVLEVGTGSGYQAAVASMFTPHVWTIEIVEPLADAARKRLDKLGYKVIEVRHGDGYFGWEEKAPFDAIIVTCAAGQIPPPLIEQLAKGGRMVIPVGGRYAVQSLMLVTKDEEGRVRSKSLMPVRFVPLLRQDPTD